MRGQVDCERSSQGGRFAIRERVPNQPVSHLAWVSLRDAVQVPHVHFGSHAHQSANSRIQLHRRLDHHIPHPDRFLDNCLHRRNDKQPRVSLGTIFGSGDLHQAILSPHLHPGPVAILHTFHKPSVSSPRPFSQNTLHHLLCGKGGIGRANGKRRCLINRYDSRGRCSRRLRIEK